jgi:hypothetical protein
MTPACPLLLSVILSLRLATAFDPAPSACSALASGVLYGAFSLQDLFPTIASGCSWTLENPGTPFLTPFCPDPGVLPKAIDLCGQESISAPCLLQLPGKSVSSQSQGLPRPLAPALGFSAL